MKREYSDVVSTVAGHALVDGGQQRPAALAGVGHAVLGDRLRLPSAAPGSPGSASAVRSSSHEATTLPRRQSSAISCRLKSYW